MGVGVWGVLRASEGVSYFYYLTNYWLVPSMYVAGLLLVYAGFSGRNGKYDDEGAASAVASLSPGVSTVAGGEMKTIRGGARFVALGKLGKSLTESTFDERTSSSSDGSSSSGGSPRKERYCEALFERRRRRRRDVKKTQKPFYVCLVFGWRL